MGDEDMNMLDKLLAERKHRAVGGARKKKTGSKGSKKSKGSKSSKGSRKGSKGRKQSGGARKRSKKVVAVGAKPKRRGSKKGKAKK